MVQNLVDCFLPYSLMSLCFFLTDTRFQGMPKCNHLGNAYIHVTKKVRLLIVIMILLGLLMVGLLTLGLLMRGLLMNGFSLLMLCSLIAACSNKQAAVRRKRLRENSGGCVNSLFRLSEEGDC